MNSSRIEDDRSGRSPWLGLLGPLLVVTAWAASFHLELLHRTLLPSPVATSLRLLDLIGTGSVLPDLALTLGRMVVGYALAAFVGVALGLVMGWFTMAYAVFAGLVDFFRSLPVTTLYPLFVLLFGIGHASKIAMVFAACVFVVILGSAYGVAHSSPIRREMARLYGADRLQIFRWVVVFDALPHTLISLRISLSYALIVEVVCEMFMGAQRGIGQRVFEAYNTYALEDLYALIIIMGVLGYCANVGFVKLERRIAHWMPDPVSS